MGQAHLDSDAIGRLVAVRGGQVEELAGDATGNVEEGGFRKGRVHAPDVADEHLDQMPDGLRVVIEKRHQRLPLQDDASRRHHRLGIHGPHRLILEDGQLAEAVPGKEHREDRFRAAAPHSRDLHLPPNDDVEDGGRVTLVKDVGARPIAALADRGCQRFECLRRDPLEQDRPGEKRDRVHDRHDRPAQGCQDGVPNSTRRLCQLT